MDLKQQYREETNVDVYHDIPLEAGAWCYTSDYVRWLEKQITETCDTCEYMHKCDSQKVLGGTILDRVRCDGYVTKKTKPSKK